MCTGARNHYMTWLRFKCWSLQEAAGANGEVGKQRPTTRTNTKWVYNKARSRALSGGGQGVHGVLLSLRGAELGSLQEFTRQPLRFQVLSIPVWLSGILFQPSWPGEPQCMKLIVPMPEKKPSAESSDAHLLSHSRGRVGKGGQGVW